MLEVIGVIGAFFSFIVGIITNVNSYKVGGLTEETREIIENDPNTDGRLEERVQKKYGKIHRGYDND